MMRRKLIIDVDTGSDDALAIMLALQQPDVDVLAITCVFGNSNIDNVCKNTLRVLDLCCKSDIPVYRGVEKSILTQSEHQFHYGRDGMGDCDWPEPVDTGRIQSEHAVLALLRLVNQYAGEITLVTLGPMTNVALAIRLDPSFGDKLKEVFVMGGNVEGRGNITRSAEFNFFLDPESADVCLRDLNKMITLIPWEPLDRQVCFSWKTYDEFTHLGTPKSVFVGKIFEKSTKLYRANYHGMLPIDLVAMATALDNSVVVKTEDVFAEIELSGRLTRGQVIIDYRRRLNMAPNIRVIREFDIEKLTTLTFNMLM
ncbi:inosine-uridine preferring nucleoside hydrolase-like [Gigantopelta aegis]|uniref:inosine-uridine preferring nucleoside hydrolase-like n=1 Tax=Gigantopelta aegis TaxID=1735272 RepID=UPI001B88B4DB|nr:inosine-uridine preferring nucleoside hydrolase-like [Gigantopelta aegis]